MNRLGPRLFLLVTAVIAGITLAFDSFRLHREREIVIRQLEREAALVTRAVEGPLQFWLRTGSRKELESLLQDIREAKGAACVGLYDTDGKLDLAASSDPGTPGTCSERLEDPTEAETLLSQWSPFGMFHILAPVPARDARIGTLKLILPSTVITDPIRQQRNVILMERGLVLTAIGIVLWLVISLGVSRPIRRLMQGVEEIAQGNLETRIEVKTRTEIGDLARAFNRMAENLREAHRRRREEEDRRIALEQQLRHADKLAVIGKLASELAHEVGTPLNVISGRARLLRRELVDGDPRTENLDIIRSQVDRISRVIKRFLELGRAPRMLRERVDLHAIVREVAAFIAPELRKKRIRLVLSLPATPAAITADPDGLSQVLLNLLMNAVAAVPGEGQIEVAVAPAEGPVGPAMGPGPAPGIEIRVKDNGHGIQPEILPRVFEPFVSTKPGEGTGLGLSICRDIVRDHRGEITADSRPGEGTTIRIWLPAATREVQHGRSTHSPH